MFRVRKPFLRCIRKGWIFCASLYRNFLPLIFFILSISWFVFFGLDLVFEKAAWPEIKVATIVIGYGIPFVNVIYDYKLLKLRYEKHEGLRKSRYQSR